jgi:hypothetical protein
MEDLSVDTAVQAASRLLERAALVQA